MDNGTWGEIKNSLVGTVGQNNFANWIEPLEFASLSDGIATFFVPTNFMGDWVQRNFGEKILAVLIKSGAQVAQLKFTVPTAPRPAARPAAKPVATTQTQTDEVPGAPLDARFTFDRFVVGKPNELAHAAARRVAEGGEVSFNPLFLYGGVGLGKTHLMHAIAHELLASSPHLRVVYLSAEQFMYRFILAVLIKSGAQVAQLKFTVPTAPRPAARPAAKPVAATQTQTDEVPGAPLDARFTFDRFVVGKPNELAHAAARRVAEGGEVSFNPLFLYGGVGLGKTHLMHAIAHELLASSPHLRVVYLSAEQFMYRFIQALRDKQMMDFKQLFRSVDVLMVDDVQFIAGKESTQEEFFHTFNALVDQNKQIIISADRAPGEIKDLEDRIKSRLQSGLVVDLHPTDYELRLGILQQKTEQHRAKHGDIPLAAGVLEFLAHRISTNVRVLEGALMRLFAFASLVGKEIDLDLTQECLADILREADRKVTIEEIQRKVSEHYNIRLSDLIGPRRVRTIARPRQMAMYLAKQLTSRSLPEIGRRFGGRDHTTVMHGVRKIEELRGTDSQIAEDLEMLRRALEA